MGIGFACVAIAGLVLLVVRRSKYVDPHVDVEASRQRAAGRLVERALGRFAKVLNIGIAALVSVAIVLAGMGLYAARAASGVREPAWQRPTSRFCDCLVAVCLVASCAPLVDIAARVVCLRCRSRCWRRSRCFRERELSQS